MVMINEALCAIGMQINAQFFFECWPCYFYYSNSQNISNAHPYWKLLFLFVAYPNSHWDTRREWGHGQVRHCTVPLEQLAWRALLKGTAYLFIYLFIHSFIFFSWTQARWFWRRLEVCKLMCFIRKSLWIRTTPKFTDQHKVNGRKNKVWSIALLFWWSPSVEWDRNVILHKTIIHTHGL